MTEEEKIRTYRFYLKNGNTFEVKAKSIKVISNSLTGLICGYQVEQAMNYFDVNVNELIAVVEVIQKIDIKTYL